MLKIWRTFNINKNFDNKIWVNVDIQTAAYIFEAIWAIDFQPRHLTLNKKMNCQIMAKKVIVFGAGVIKIGRFQLSFTFLLFLFYACYKY